MNAGQASTSSNGHVRQIVFDFDGVFTTQDSTQAWLTPHLRARPLRLLQCLPWLVGFALSGRWQPVRTWFTRKLLNTACAGERADLLLADLRRFGAEMAADVESTLADAVAQIQAHRAHGDQVTIVSAGLEPLLAGWFAKKGLDVEIVASRLDPTDDNHVKLTEHCFAERKVERLNMLGLRSWDLVYTDSAHDLPLMRFAEKTVLVNPSSATHRLAKARTHSRILVVSWQATPSAC